MLGGLQRDRQQGNCIGTCSGTCTGSATALLGHLHGTCEADVTGSCTGECYGTCDATWMAECNGEADIMANAECKAACETRANAHATCDPPTVTIVAVAVTDTAKNARIDRARRDAEGRTSRSSSRAARARVRGRARDVVVRHVAASRVDVARDVGLQAAACMAARSMPSPTR